MRPNGQPRTSGGKPKKRHPSGRAANHDGKPMSGHREPAQPSLPTWVWGILINLLVLGVGVGTTYGLMKGDVTNMDLRINSLNNTLGAQISRIDKIVQEQDRITRLEERLGNVVGLLQEIRSDLRDGRYAVRRDGTITSSPPGAAR